MKKLFIFFILITSVLTQAQELPKQIYCKSSSQKAVNLFLEGKRSLSNGQIDVAQKFFYNIVQEDSTFCDAQFYLGYTYQLQDEWELAANYYVTAYQLNNSVPFYIQNLGQTLIVLGYHKKACEIFMRLVEIDPENPEGYYGIAMSAEALDHNNSAMKYLEKAMELYLNKNKRIKPEISLLLGILLAKRKKYDQAIETLEKNYKEFEKQDRINFYLGMSYYYYDGTNEEYLKDKQKKARKYLEKAKNLGSPIDDQILQDLSIE